MGESGACDQNIEISATSKHSTDNHLTQRSSTPTVFGVNTTSYSLSPLSIAIKESNLNFGVRQCNPEKENVDANSKSNERNTRLRSIFTCQQLERLEAVYRKGTGYISRTERCLLAEEIKIDEQKVKVWFQNRRMKEKKMHFFSQHPRVPRRCNNRVDCSCPKNDNSDVPWIVNRYFETFNPQEINYMPDQFSFMHNENSTNNLLQTLPTQTLHFSPQPATYSNPKKWKTRLMVRFLESCNQYVYRFE